MQKFHVGDKVKSSIWKNAPEDEIVQVRYQYATKRSGGWAEEDELELIERVAPEYDYSKIPRCHIKQKVKTKDGKIWEVFGFRNHNEKNILIKQEGQKFCDGMWIRRCELTAVEEDELELIERAHSNKREKEMKKYEHLLELWKNRALAAEKEKENNKEKYDEIRLDCDKMMKCINTMQEQNKNFDPVYTAKLEEENALLKAKGEIMHAPHPDKVLIGCLQCGNLFKPGDITKYCICLDCVNKLEAMDEEEKNNNK